MSEVRLLLRSVLLLCAAILLGTCAAHDRSILAGNPCKGMAGDANRNAPIVCVNDDAKILSVSHPVIRLNHTSSGAPVMIHWYTKSGSGPLAITMKKSGCVTDVECDGGGKCKAKAVRVTEETQCKYDVEVNDGKHDLLDPDVVVVPCC